LVRVVLEELNLEMLPLVQVATQFFQRLLLRVVVLAVMTAQDQ
jgi:hypothetical protein